MKKIAVLAVAAVLAVGGSIGSATYALFTSEAQNTNNSFKSGTLSLSTHHHDVPVEGPMFYQNDSEKGQMGTGYWAPRDSHTRAMFIKNTGSLDAKLTHIIAKPEGNREDALKFGEQAMVTVASFKTSNGKALDATAAKKINEEADKEFKKLINGKFWERVIAVGLQAAAAEVREDLLEWTYRVNSSGESVTVGISDIYIGSLKDLYNGGAGQDTEVPNLILPAGQTMQLSYTVTFLDDAGQTFKNNDIRGTTVNFGFVNQFEQVKHN
ncbi:SipW-dependent-type signal peptide-containing protein [Brevibacillus centrosporus]|uniref:SipW-dependent-type signal peptide-containing protein n=1 Tax=Brevibacillus centrosporus TaxID=54910 RepID=UPI003D1E69A7